MARSFIEDMLSGISDFGSQALDRGSELMSDMAGRNVDAGFGKQVLGNMGIPVNFIDSLSEGTTPTQTSPGSSLLPADSGSSMGEEAKANAKYQEAHAKALESIARKKQLEADAMSEQLAMLRGRSQAADSDVFVAKGDNVIGGSGKQKGNFSRTNAPIAAAGGSILSRKEAKEMGVSDQMLSFLNKLSSSKDEGDRAALEMMAKNLPQKTSLANEVDEILREAQSSKDPIAALAVAKIRLSAKGIPEEQIQKMLSVLRNP